MEKACENCKFWSNEFIQRTNNFRICHSDIYEYEGRGGNIDSNIKFLYWDYESYSASFATRNDFYCIGYKAEN